MENLISCSSICFLCTADGNRNCKKSLGNAEGMKRANEDALLN